MGLIRDSSRTSVYFGNSAPNGANSGIKNLFEPTGLFISFFVYKLPSRNIFLARLRDGFRSERFCLGSAPDSRHLDFSLLSANRNLTVPVWHLCRCWWPLIQFLFRIM